MQCAYYSAGQCLSCSQLTMVYSAQIMRKQQTLVTLLAPLSPAEMFAPVTSPEQGFRNKAKMVVQGSVDKPILGIINHKKQAIDLSECPLYPQPFSRAFEHIRAFIQRAMLEPYNIRKRQGELKYVLLSFSQSSQRWMLRLVLRSEAHLASIRQHLPWLQERWPELLVCSVNLQSEHKAVLEGDTEILLTAESMLSEKLNQVPLYLQPQCFFQTNSAMAAKLYQTAKDWVEPLALSRCWDLFCGVGGFGLHLASNNMVVTGIEISAAAIACASRSAAEMELHDFNFQALDSDAFAKAQQQPPQLLVVNPPRRGLGKGLCRSIQQLQPDWLLYSSCNPDTLLSDLTILQEYQLEKVQLFDMFPHTQHVEVLTLLKHRG